MSNHPHETIWMDREQLFGLQPFQALSARDRMHAGLQLPRVLRHDPEITSELPHTEALYGSTGKVLKTVETRKRRIQAGIIDVAPFLIYGRDQINPPHEYSGVASIVRWKHDDDLPPGMITQDGYRELSAWLGPTGRMQEYRLIFAALERQAHAMKAQRLFSVAVPGSRKDVVLGQLGFDRRSNTAEDVPIGPKRPDGSSNMMQRNVWLKELTPPAES